MARFNLSRRGFLAYAATSVASVGMTVTFPAFRSSAQTAAPTELKIVRRNLEVLQRSANVFGIVRVNGDPGLILEPGERFRVNLENQGGEDAIIHWHGMTPPYLQDGVSDAQRPLISSGESVGYEFSPQPGTHWMHSHHGLQEQLLMAAPLIVRTKEDVTADVQEVIVLLHDFSFRNPADLLAGLTKGEGEAHDMSNMDMSGMGSMNMSEMANMPGMNGMDMPGMATPGTQSTMQMDINDIDYDAYLANDRTLEDPQVVKVERGGRVRLRLINGATSTAFNLYLGELTGTLLAVDGNGVKPIEANRFGVSMGQRLDILLKLPGSGAFPIFAQREWDISRTGIVLATPDAPVKRQISVAIDRSPAFDLALEERLVALAPLEQRPADLTHKMALTGSMRPYVWSIDDLTWEQHRPVQVSEGQRVVIEMTNRTMMAHPMHLHGHHFQVTGINGRPINGAVRDTVLVPANASVSIAFDAANPGRWPLHCHNLLHMATGMMTEVVYGKFA